MPAIRAVLFDLGNTLVSYYRPPGYMPVLRRSLQACLMTLGLGPLGHEAETELLHQALELNPERADLAVWPLEQRLRILFRDQACDPETVDRLARVFLEPIFATAQVSEDTLPLLAGLKRRGIRTGVVSNTPWGSPGRFWRSELARHDLLAALDAAVFCTDVGWRKPHPMPFTRALHLLGVSPQEAVFVGDDPAWDLEGARSAGIHPILLASRRAGVETPAVLTVDSLADVLDQIDLLNAKANAGRMPAFA
jgi:FMN phosphatase YigB (HAD superfamily)